MADIDNLGTLKNKDGRIAYPRTLAEGVICKNDDGTTTTLDMKLKNIKNDVFNFDTLTWEDIEQ